MDFEPFSFRINDNAIPELLEGYKPETKKPGRPEEEKFDPYRHITEQQHRIALEAVFGLKHCLYLHCSCPFPQEGQFQPCFQFRTDMPPCVLIALVLLEYRVDMYLPVVRPLHQL